MADRTIKVLVAEDSAAVRMLLVHLLESDPRIRVVGIVSDGQAAFDFVRGHKPDVVLMDIHMPRLNGFEATRRIMETHALPIVICTATSDPEDVDVAFRAMEAGAIACIEKPLGVGHSDFEASAAHLLETVKLMSEVKVVRRTARPPATRPIQWQGVQTDFKLVGIGASTGGPQVLQSIFANLPKEFPVPVLVVQHIAHGFLAGLVDWLNHSANLAIHVAANGECPLPGHVYLAPSDFQMGISASGRIVLTKDAPESGLRPCVSYLFRSLAAVHGPNALGVLLTGMGKDGAMELKTMKDKGAITIAQDMETSVIHGMPGVAIALGGATHVLPADKIADALVAFVNGRNGSSRS